MKLQYKVSFLLHKDSKDEMRPTTLPIKGAITVEGELTVNDRAGSIDVLLHDAKKGRDNKRTLLWPIAKTFGKEVARYLSPCRSNAEYVEVPKYS
jgi:hypothetical protein